MTIKQLGPAVYVYSIFQTDFVPASQDQGPLVKPEYEGNQGIHDDVSTVRSVLPAVHSSLDPTLASVQTVTHTVQPELCSRITTCAKCSYSIF